MKKTLTLILALVMVLASICCFASCGETEDKPVLNVYTNAGFAPYEYLDEKGNVVGVDIDVIKYIGEKLGYKVVINDIEFNQVLNEVAKDKNAVGASGMSKKPERDEIALASDVYATSVQYVIAPKGTFEGEIVPIADVVEYIATTASKSIGCQKGTTGCDMVASAVEGTEVQNIEYTNAIVASNDIGSTVDAVVIDKMPAESICKNNDKLQCWCLDGEMESYVMYFNKDNADLVAKVNTELKAMIEAGMIDEYTIAHSGK